MKDSNTIAVINAASSLHIVQRKIAQFAMRELATPAPITPKPPVCEVCADKEPAIYFIGIDSWICLVCLKTAIEERTA